MFKKFYKAANDDIKPDSELLSKILKSVREDKPKHVHTFRMLPVAAVIALAILLTNSINITDINTVTTGEKEVRMADNSSNYSFTTKDISDAVVMKINFSEEASVSQASMCNIESTVNDKQEEISAKEYFDKLRFSPDILEIPDGLIADFSLDSIVQDGKNTFLYSGENILSITTSSNREDVLLYLENEEYEKSVFGNNTAVVLYDGSVYRAYIIHPSGTALEIITDMSKENLQKLLISASR